MLYCFVTLLCYVALQRTGLKYISNPAYTLIKYIYYYKEQQRANMSHAILHLGILYVHVQYTLVLGYNMQYKACFFTR
jgi:hypothetical protein